MNAQQQDALRLLTARGPMTSRELFDVMQDELGYWSQASTHDQQSAAIEALSKILSKMKTANLLYGYMCPQAKGRPVMVWSASITEKSDGEIYAESSARHAPQELHDMAKSMFENGFAGPPDDDDSTVKDSLTVHDDHISQSAEMVSDRIELQSMDDDSRAIEYMKELDGGLQVLNTASVIRSSNGIEIITMKIYASDACYLNGEAVIRNRAELAQFIGAIERMLP